MNRTVRLLLRPTPEQVTALAETLDQFTAVFNAVCAYGWQQRERNGVRLHQAMYYPLRVTYPHLVSDLHIQARVKATEAVKSALTRLLQGRMVRCPRSKRCPARLNHHTLTVKWAERIAVLSTTQGRQRIAFRIPAYAQKYVGYKVCTADLIQRGDKFWLHVVVDVPAPEARPSGQVIGVDLGLVRPAVTSHNKFFGQRRWRELEARYFRLRRALQAKGTRSARRHIRRLKGKQLRLRRDLDHQLSRQIVNSVAPGSIIVVEDLKNIRTRVKQRKGKQNRRIHGWSFAQLRAFLTYKAEEKGCVVVGVDPRHTSQTCPRCGCVYRHNRRSQSEFRCRDCGFRLNADLVGARNIAAKYLASVGTPDAGGPPVNRPIVSHQDVPGVDASCRL